MIISQHVTIKVCSSNIAHWKSKGYVVSNLDRRNLNIDTIEVDVKDLLSESNVNVKCKCDECKNEYVQRFSRNTDTCYKCRKTKTMIGNNYGSATKGRTYPHLQGEKHPRWNPKKTEFKKYWNKVASITKRNYNLYKTEINPAAHPRTRCGVDGGWQLDHRISVKKGFLDNISPEIIGGKDNLQMLPWKDNRDKW